jgi:predicted component of type VI protein secretion system
MPTLRTRQNQATAAKDRLQPALLDRLTDHEPHMRTERPDAVFVNESRLREALLRDLGWLLNARDAWDHVEMEGLEHVQRSAINYGMPPLAGQLLSTTRCSSRSAASSGPCLIRWSCCSRPAWTWRPARSRCKTSGPDPRRRHTP